MSKKSHSSRFQYYYKKIPHFLEIFSFDFVDFFDKIAQYSKNVAP
jgi:hypothetical protein